MDKCFWKGKLLRLRKQDLVKIACNTGTNTSSFRFPTSEGTQSIDNHSRRIVDKSFHYVCDVVRPLLASQFLDLGIPLEVDASFAKKLHHQTIHNEASIPAHRRASWRLAEESTQQQTGTKAALGALVIKDYRLSDRPLTQQPTNMRNNSRTWSLELKPKAGYTPLSPLVHPDRRIKFTTTRFQLMQQAKALSKQQQQSTGNGSKHQDGKSTVAASSYDPRLLFSQNIAKIRSALDQLMECPSNNLKLWYKDRHTAASATLVPLSSDNDQQQQVLDIAAQILHREPFLGNLLALQKLDLWMDADGAILLFQHLVSLCAGSQEKAVMLVDDYEQDDSLQELCNMNESQNHSSVAPFLALAGDSTRSNLDDFIDYMSNFWQTNCVCSSDDVMADVSETILDQAYRHCTQTLIPAMTERETVHLLQLWLLSLAMCDVSFFVTIEMHDNDHGTRTEQLQGEDAPGALAVDLCGTENKSLVWVTYSIKAIDCDVKPAYKVATREAKEVSTYKLLVSRAASS